MKANELMVGDYVTFRDCLDDGEILSIKVMELHGYDTEFLASIGGDEALDTLDLEHEIVGIPLTPEILEKNGFKSWEHGHVWKERIGMGGQTTSASSPIEIIIYEEGHSVIMNPHEGKEFQGSIDFVHELQHALRLCGIDKEIIL